MTVTEVPVIERGSAVSLKELSRVCSDRERSFCDDVVSLKSLRMDPDEPGQLIIQRGVNAPRESVEFMPHVYRQAPGVLYGLPGSYLQKLVDGDHNDPVLAALNFNHWVAANKDREVLLRFIKRNGDGKLLRAMLPASWNPIPYQEVIRAMVSKHGKDQQVMVERFDEMALTYNMITGKLDRGKAVVGDDVEWGMRFSDSDVGFGQLLLLPYTYTLWCTNGCTTLASGAHVRISHSTKLGGDMNNVLSNIRQGMEMITGYSSRIVEQMDAAEAVALDEKGLDETIKRINKRYDITRLEDKYVREAWVMEGERRDANVLRLANSYTRAANSEELKVDSRFKLQGVGGSVLEMAGDGYRWN